MARVLKMSRDSIIVASKGSAVILSLITILCCGIIFVSLVWVPFFIKSSKSYLQVFVDELCLRLYQELPFTARFNQLNLNLDLRDDRSALSVALNRVRTLINFNGPVAFVGIVPSQANRDAPNFRDTLDVGDLAFFQVNLRAENRQTNQWTLSLNRLDPREDPPPPIIPQFAEHLEALHPTRSENSVVICFSQGTIQRAAWMLPLMRQQATVSAISGLFQNISNINSSPPLRFVDLANNPLRVNTYPSPLVLFEWDNQQENFPVCSGEGGNVRCDTDPDVLQQFNEFNVRRVAKKLTAIHLINLLARNGATRHSTRVGIVWQGQNGVEGVLIKAVGDDVFSISFDPPPGLTSSQFSQPLCRYYSSRKTSLEGLFANSGLFRTLDCQGFVQSNQLDVLDVIYFSDLIDRDNLLNQGQPFNGADELPLSPHIIWIGTRPETFEIFLETVFIPAIRGAGNIRPVLTAILFPTTANVPINRLAAVLAHLNLIRWDPRSNRVTGLTFRSPFFNIFVFDGCGYIDVPNKVSEDDDPPSPYWECLTDNTSRLDGNVFQDFLRAFAEGNAMPQFPDEGNLAPFVQEGRVTGDTIAERLAVYIYRTFLTSRGWLF